MEELSKATDNPKLRPDKSLYDRVVEAWEALGAGDEIEKLRISQSEMYAEEAESTKKATSQQHAIKSEDDVRKAMKQLGVSLDGNEKFQADTLTFNRIIRQLANAEVPQGGQIAEEIFVYMLDQYLNHANVKLKPDIITFNTVILAHSKSKHPERCKRFLKNLQELHDGGMLLDIKADLISYNTVIHAYQRSNIPNAGQEAERVFDELSRHLKPDAISLSGLLGVYAAKGDPYRAEELLLYFYKQHTANRHKPTPDTTCFDQVLLAWAKKGGKKATGRAEMLLKLMEDMASAPNSIVSPTTTTYNIVLNALSRSGDQNAPLRALGLLERMKAKLDKRKPWKKLARPCSITYTTLIAVICRLSTRRALETVELLLDEAINSPDIKTDCMFFSSVLSSLASCGEQGTSTFAKNLIERRMPDLGLSPDISCWNGLLNTFAKRGMGEEAEETLEMLEKGLLGPNVQSYSIVLDAYAKSRDPVSINRAESLIERMNESTSFKPDAKAFTALIQKYARSNLPQKAKKAQTVLERMKEGAKDGIVGMRPTVVTYNAVLNACEYTNSTDVKEQEEAFAVGCVTFDEVRQEFRPTHTTYGSFLGVVSKLMPKSDARNEIAELVFKRCCKDGQVSAYVLRKLKATVSLSQYRQMLRGKSEERLPRSWTANVMERRHERAVPRQARYAAEDSRRHAGAADQHGEAQQYATPFLSLLSSISS
ncbi:Pentatricopeptide repeat-containing protein [Seminavis robusta]|uniref:Pentatricopeptide repeat-containing protein n=1 Tax=Seminavis robusta TaxID=568900 RepID=A0A9N8EAF0_9STRA|nr:Pentatricopeptide repeat-containing protein [Seminavis robusta]|eukprot:Sro880_g215160.1 Pentatricopeptide repeat-containing protein (710) ;mRNA; r:41116-43345